jgi:HEAT repeats
LNRIALPMLATTIPPIVRRHLEDAAFYWQQIDTSPQEYGLGAKRLLHFTRVLAGHLEGLRVAGGDALAPALDNLTQWRQPGEAYAAVYVALTSGNVQAQAEVFGCIARDPSGLLRGAIGALASAPQAHAHAWLQSAFAELSGTTPDATPQAITQLVAALRASSLRNWPVPDAVQTAALTHAQPWVRAAAARCLGAQQEPSRLLPLLQDTDSAVQAEAAIALGALGPANRLLAAGTLWQCVAAQAQACAQATGWYQMQAQRRLARWLCHLAHLAPLGHPDVVTLLAHLPLRQALGFVLHHGDAAHLPFVLRALDDPQQSRWAGFVWQSLTGVDLVQAGLHAPEPVVDLDAPLTRSQQDADQGLPLPKPQAVRDRSASMRLPLGQALLLGHARSKEQLAHWLHTETDTPHLLRCVAAGTWNAKDLSPRIQLRADLTTLLRQDAALAALAPAAPLAA